MNWKSLMVGIGIGFVSGYATKELLQQNTNISPEKALATAKASFKKLGPISGSWIHMKTEAYEVNQIQHQVYKGGISRTFDDITEQYEFIADARTGTIIDAYPIG
ncbi:PepSY domain-containing protein [Cytobacillus spongiae]|jgi:predicted small secreted protein|uniref:PepSY domain-containing protein n=1 Tax=Cytobacillus spongiae TaxID=2901381 RepID=UPI001F251392|nr:PepSY domain-containing protein [Cytobacillus spongiae]UII55236.1 PepSY domain-containing protein [Cytobacillus spongiae]